MSIAEIPKTALWFIRLPLNIAAMACVLSNLTWPAWFFIVIGADIHLTDDLMVYAAAYNGNATLVRLLMRRGARNYDLAMYAALKDNSREVVLALMEFGVPIKRHYASLIPELSREEARQIARRLLKLHQ